MILQCDQCGTRFRLDDAKLKPGGVKVRCSKCRHVFLAGAEQKHEESEFDAILSGLGAQAPEQQQEAAPVKQEAAESGFAQELAAGPEATAFGFEEEPAAGPEAAAFGFEEEPAVGPEAAAFGFEEEPAAGPEATAFGFEEEPAAGHQAPAPTAAEPDLSDFADFDFPVEPFVAQDKEASTPQEQTDFAAFDFEPEATRQNEAPAAAVAQGLDYGEFAFDDEPPAMREEPVSAPDQASDFGDFSFDEEPAAKMEETATAAPGALDFGDFDFDATPIEKPQEQQAVHDELDFGEFSFAEEPAVKGEEPPPEKDALDFGEFSFDEEPPLINEAPASEASDDFASFSFDEELLQKQGEEPAPVQDDDFGGLSDFSLSHDLSAKEALAAAEPAEPGTTAGAAAAAGIAGAAALFGAAGAAAPTDAGRAEPTAQPVAPETGARTTPRQETPLDFDIGAKPVPGRVPEESAEEEELPPLSISSRRKGRSILTVSIVAFCVLVILALSAAGLYLLQSGPAALQRFDKLGLGFVPKWFGIETPEDGRITIRNPVASFYQNREAGEIFVVTGEAVNSYRKARASIHVKVSLFDKNGAVLVQKTAYCGNRLSKEQLATLPMAQIESIMNNQFGDSLANLGVKPGQSIGFVVAVPNVPKEAADFGVEVVGSTVAGQ